MKNRIFKQLFTVLAGSILGFSAYAQSPSSIPTTPGTYTVQYQEPDFLLNHYAKSGEFLLTLNTGPDYNYGDENFAVEVVFTVESYDDVNTLISAYQDTLRIDEQAPEQVFRQEITDMINNQELDHFDVIISSVNTNASPVMSSLLNEKLTAAYDVDYGVDVRKSSDNTKEPVVINTASSSFFLSSPSQRVKTFTWENNDYLFPNYELQVLKLNNIDTSKTDDDREITAEIDWSKALTIETQSNQTFFRLTVAEGTGYYVWRVRPMGTYYEGGYANSRNYGVWSTAPANGTSKELEITDVAAGLQNNPYFFFVDPDDDKNWIYSRVFTEGTAGDQTPTRVSETMTYANKLQQVEQTQTHLPSQNRTIVTQKVMDYSGRPAVTSMPVPVQEQGLNNYKEFFMRNDSTAKYTAADFDQNLHYNADSSGPVLDSATAFEYYSDDNPDIRIPDGEGYSYTRTLFHNDGTGRVKEETGVGKTHALGKQPEGKGRTTKTYYATPSDQELISVFGDEAPEATTVLKSVQVDPNNTTTITYTNRSGKTLATALLTNENESTDTNVLLSPLPSQPENQVSLDDTVSYNVQVNDEIVSSKRLAFAEPTDVTLSYLLACDQVVPCVGEGISCSYQLIVAIHNMDHPDTVGANHNYRFEKNLDMVNCGDSIEGYKHVFWPDTTDTTQALVLNLPSGNYMVEKRLVPVNDSMMTGVADAVSKVKEGIQPLFDLVLAKYDDIEELQDFHNFLQDMLDLDAALYPDTNVAISNYGLTDFDFYLHDPRVYLLDINGDTITDLDAGRPVELHIVTNCCKEVIPVDFVPPFKCPEMDSLLAYGPGHPDLDFEAYMRNRITDNTVLAEVVPMEFLVPGVINTMVYDMLTDTTDNCNNPPYECRDLWQCWIGVIGGIEEVLNQDSTLGLVSEGVDEESGGPDTFNDHMDEEADLGLLASWLLNAVLSAKMRDMEEAPSMEDVNLITQFLECTGYRIESFVDSASLSPEDSWQVMGYTPGDCPTCEEIYCFNSNGITTTTPCDPIACPEDYTSWDCMQWEQFFYCVKNCPTPPDPEDTDEPDCPVDTVYENSLEAKIESCEDKCADRRAEFEGAVRNMFIENCYVIGACKESLDDNVVPEQDIDIIVDTLVARCQRRCHLTPQNPYCNKYQCDDAWVMDIEYGTECENFFRQQAMAWDFELGITSKCNDSYDQSSPLCSEPAPADSCNTENTYTRVQQFEVKAD